jgi:erythromycin esterase
MRNPRRVLGLLVILPFLAACHARSAGPLPDAGIGADLEPAPDLGPPLPSGISRLRGSDPAIANDADLAAIDAVIGDAQAVGLGESIHTSGGFHDVKTRIVRHLVEDKGFRLITWEWQRTSGDVVEAYLQTCSGDAKHAAAQLSVWSSVQVERLLEWVCSFNQAHPDDRVHFMGFDVQQPAEDLDTLTSWLTAHASADAPALTADLGQCDRAATGGASYVGKYQPCQAALTAIEGYLTDHAAALEAATSHEQVELARIAQIGALAWQGTAFNYAANIKASFQARDDGMGEVFRRLTALRYPDQKTIVWAHNYHLRMAGASVTGQAAIGAPNMGMHLVEQLGKAYVPIGITGYEVYIDWPNVGCGLRDVPEGNDSMEETLEALDVGDLFVDLETTGPSPVFVPNAPYGEGNMETMVPGAQYRGLVFLRSSAAMDPLDWPKCTPM